MELRVQQSLFAQLIAQFILWCYEVGYELTLGEAWRSPEEAELQAQEGKGIVHSLHTERLAMDLNLFKTGALLTRLEDYRPLGEKWKTMHPLARWGGDFTCADVDHFSLEYGGRQ